MNYQSRNMLMLAKVIHDNISAGGGSERLAIVTMALLAEMGFKNLPL